MKIALYRGNSFIGKAIRWQTRGIYSHASIVLPEGEVIEAKEFCGVRRLRGIAADKGERVDLFEFPHTLAQGLKIVQFLHAQIGKPYDYLGIARFITREPEDHWKMKSWFCSCLVFAAVKEGGIELLRDTPAWKVSPSLLGMSPLLKSST